MNYQLLICVLKKRLVALRNLIVCLVFFPLLLTQNFRDDMTKYLQPYIAFKYGDLVNKIKYPRISQMVF